MSSDGNRAGTRITKCALPTLCTETRVSPTARAHHWTGHDPSALDCRNTFAPALGSREGWVTTRTHWGNRGLPGEMRDPMRADSLLHRAEREDLVQGDSPVTKERNRHLNGSRSPRIAFVIDAVHPFNTGGRERRLSQVTRRLARNGYDVHIYTMKWWSGPNTIAMDGVSLHAICGLNRPGFRLHPLCRRGAGRSTTQALLFGLATLRLPAEPFDTLDVDQMPYFPLFAARLVCSLRRKPLNATWHEVWGREYWASHVGRSARLADIVEHLAARVAWA